MHKIVTPTITLISTWLKVFPLCTPTTEPIISGSTIMFLICVFIQAGFSIGGASFFAFRSLQQVMDAFYINRDTQPTDATFS